MNEIRGRNILHEVKARSEVFRPDFAQKKVTIIRFLPDSKETNTTTLAKYEAAKYSTDSKVKTFQFLGCEVDSKLLPHQTTTKEFTTILMEASNNPLTVAIIVQNPIPTPKFKQTLEIIPPEKDLDGLRENHPLFKASATSETIARLVKSFADSNTQVAVVGAKGFVGQGVIRLLESDNIRYFGLDQGDDLLRTHDADIVVSATGVPELLDERHLVSKHKLVVDAGFVPLSAQQILGDVNRSAYNIPQYLTPVPGGIGPLQMATLLERLISMATDKSVEKWQYQPVEATKQVNVESRTQVSSKATPQALWNKYSQELSQTPPVLRTRAVIQSAFQDGILELDQIAQILQFDPQVQKIRRQQGVDKAQEYVRTVFLSATRSQDQSSQPQPSQQYQPKQSPGFEL